MPYVVVMLASRQGQSPSGTLPRMHRLIRISGLAVLLLGSGLSTGMLPSAAGQAPAEKVTTDTLTYCHQLAARLDQLKSSSVNPPAEVNDLGVAGKDMCEHGSVRGGILRLRSAIVILMHPTGDGDGDPMRMGRTE
jgi:hypothetical protein